jgi:DNA (cytosine-5)-methyltransferase 1
MLDSEIIVDNFAGGGGASTGIALALGRSPDLAVNHDPEAIAMHEANHPGALHFCGDVWDVKPAEVARGRRVGLAWFSPDCKHFSKAKNGAPNRDEKVRGLAWVVIRWAKEVRPRVIILENVEEFQTWGPLVDGRPCPERKGETFKRWLRELKRYGYVVEWRELRACDYGAPTTRKRLFLIARSDGRPIVWPEPTHGPGRLPYRTAAECIDYSLPCPSIFGRARPLADNTLRRIARGIERFVLPPAEPFVIRGAAHTMVQTGYGERPGQAPRCLDLHKPLGTIIAGGGKNGNGKHALVSAFLAKHYGGHETPGAPLTRPFDTITCIDHHSLVEVTHARDHRPDVRAFLRAYGLSDETRVRGERFVIVDIGMRMLQPRELYNAQGFPCDYRIELDVGGRPLPARAQTRMCGNSVSPMMARALVAAQFDGERTTRIAA